MYAIIENGGKQYKVSEGDTFQIEKVAVEEGNIVKDSKVLLVSDDKGITVGKPYVDGAEVSLKVLTALRNIFLESTGLLSWYKKQGILNVPIGLFVIESIKS